MLIIPAIDILDGKLVRLEKGNYNSGKVYSDDPFSVASLFDEIGFDLIHIVDLSGSKQGKIQTIDLLKKIKSNLGIKIQFGGGIRSADDAKLLLEIQVDFLVIGSLSIINPEEYEKIISLTGSDKIVNAIDSENELVRIKGWTENSQISVYDHIEFCFSKGTTKFLCTDITKDGMLSGPNLSLYKKIKELFPQINLTASGGISSLSDVLELKEINIYVAVIGKAIYENKIDLKELKKIAG